MLLNDILDIWTHERPGATRRARVSAAAAFVRQRGLRASVEDNITIWRGLKPRQLVTRLAPRRAFGMSVAQCAPIGGGGGASKIFGPGVEKHIADERKLLAPAIPPGAVVLSEAGPIAYYLDGVISGARRAPAALAPRRAAAADTKREPASHGAWTDADAVPARSQTSRSST